MMRKEFFFVAFEAGMLLKTNETGTEAAEFNYKQLKTNGLIVSVGRFDLCI
jgi:hypothetical protein